MNNTDYWVYSFGNNSWTTTDVKGVNNTKYKIDLSRNGFYVDNVKISDVNEIVFETGCNIYLGSLNNNGSKNHSYSAGGLVIYDCKIYESKDLIRYFIPCYRKSDNHIGMYDVVNDVFYMNLGAEAFIKGTDIPNNSQLQ